ncbi:MAG: hypothetical protein WCF55_24410 [Pseudolabrys sp.]
MMGQTVADHLNEGAEQTNASSEKLKRRAASRKIGKIIKKCKAETKVIKRLDDEQKEFLERLRKHFLALRCNH